MLSIPRFASGALRPVDNLQPNNRWDIRFGSRNEWESGPLTKIYFLSDWYQNISQVTRSGGRGKTRPEATNG